MTTVYLCVCVVEGGLGEALDGVAGRSVLLNCWCGQKQPVSLCRSTATQHNVANRQYTHQVTQYNTRQMSQLLFASRGPYAFPGPVIMYYHFIPLWQKNKSSALSGALWLAAWAGSHLQYRYKTIYFDTLCTWKHFNSFFLLPKTSHLLLHVTNILRKSLIMCLPPPCKIMQLIQYHLMTLSVFCWVVIRCSKWCLGRLP